MVFRLNRDLLRGFEHFEAFVGWDEETICRVLILLSSKNRPPHRSSSRPLQLEWKNPGLVSFDFLALTQSHPQPIPRPLTNNECHKESSKWIINQVELFPKTKAKRNEKQIETTLSFRIDCDRLEKKERKRNCWEWQRRNALSPTQSISNGDEFISNSTNSKWDFPNVIVIFMICKTNYEEVNEIFRFEIHRDGHADAILNETCKCDLIQLDAIRQTQNRFYRFCRNCLVCRLFNLSTVRLGRVSRLSCSNAEWRQLLECSVQQIALLGCVCVSERLFTLAHNSCYIPAMMFRQLISLAESSNFHQAIYEIPVES